MKVIFVGAGPGDPDLMTVKARRLVETCCVCVYAGSLVSPDVVALIPDKAETHDSAAMDLDAIIAVCRDAQARDVDVIRLHTGDPSVYGAINEQMSELDALGIDYEVVPGVSAFQAAAAALRTELTAPGVSQTVVLTRVAGRTPVPEGQDLASLAQSRATLCLFLSVHKLDDVAATLVPAYGADCPVAVVHRASWPDERVVRGTLETIASLVDEADIRKTAMVLVGRALAREGEASKLYDAGFSHGYREGSDQ